MIASFRTRIDRALGAQPRQLQNMLAYFAAFGGLGLLGSLVGPTLPTLAEQTGSRVGALGLIFFLRSLGFTIGTVTLGRLVDRVKINQLMGACAFADGLAVILIPFLHSNWLLGAVFMFAGLMESVIAVAANTGIVWMFNERANPVITGLHFSFGLGAFIGPVIVAQLINQDQGVKLSYWIVSAFLLLVGVILLLRAHSPLPSESHEEARAATTRSDYVLVAVTSMMLFFYVGAEISFSGWYFTFLTSLNVVVEQTAAYMNSAFWLTFTAGRLIAVLLSMRVKSQTILLVALLGCLVAVGMLILLPPLPAVLWLVPALTGFFMAPIFPVAFAWASESLRLTGRLTGIIFMGDSIGAMLLPWLAGMLLDTTGPQMLAPTVFLIVFLNLAAYLIMRRLVAHRQKQARPASAS
ncbi:MAG: MFS transporter [Chloroflexi bacterium]|nr:MFS transporter [Chloroflexota bacterium]